MERSLIYVSSKTPRFSEQPTSTDDIVAVARSRNAALGVTGAFIETATAFAQILEGTQTALDELMDSIDRDAEGAGDRPPAAGRMVDGLFGDIVVGSQPGHLADQRGSTASPGADRAAGDVARRPGNVPGW